MKALGVLELVAAASLATACLATAAAGGSGASSGTLVFATGGDGRSDRLEIASVGADGKHFRKLTHVAPPGIEPRWSSDGRRILFLTVDTFVGEAANWSMRADGSGRRRLPGLEWDVPSPDGRLVHLYNRIVDANGHVVRRLHPGLGADDYYGGPPLWSPNGRFITLNVVKLNKVDDVVGAWIDVIPTTSGGRGVAVTARRVGRFTSALSWSPDSRRMLIETRRGRSDDWYTVTADGSNRRRLLHVRGGLWENHAWSPDSRQIAFVGRSGGIFVMDARDGRRHRIMATRYRGDDAGYVDLDWSSAGEIAFSDKGGTYVVRPDGTGRRRVSTRAGAAKWSPDGRKLVLSSGRDVYVLDRHGGERRLTRWMSDSEPQLSPDGRRVAFVRGRSVDVTTPSVYVMNADGSGRRALGPGRRPRWSPDGTRIAYVVDGVTPPNNRIVIADPNAAARRAVIGGESPTWSPDGRLAFMRYDYVFEDRGDHGGAQWYIAKSKLIVAHADGGDEQVVAAFDGIGAGGPQSAEDPAWSPDGRSIALEFSSDYDSIVLLVDPIDRTQRRLASGGAGEWSPDGTRILGWNYDMISTIDATTGNRTEILQLTSGRVQSATWSPDGATIGFTRCDSDDSVCDVYSVAVEAGSKPTRLTKTRGVEFGLDWGGP